MNTRKIDIYLNGEYIGSTNQSRTCKEAVARIRRQPALTVASVPHEKSYEIKPTDALRAYYAKCTP